MRLTCLAQCSSPSQLDGRSMVRVTIGVESTEREHVQKLWLVIQKTAQDCLEPHSVRPNVVWEEVDAAFS